MPWQRTNPGKRNLCLVFASVVGHTATKRAQRQISGASVWQARKVNGPIWSPEQAFSVIGVQSSYKHSKYIRAKSWWAVAKVLEGIDATLADVVRTELGVWAAEEKACKK